MKIALILNNIRSNENVGSIFRTADAGGVCQIFLVGYTPAPVDKFGRKNKALSKSALGAEMTTPWQKVKTLSGAIKKLNSYKIVAIEQSESSVDYRKLKKYKNIALVLGNEVTGLYKKDLEKCDLVAEIPMKGEKESLNVSVAFGIALYALI